MRKYSLVAADGNTGRFVDRGFCFTRNLDIILAGDNDFIKSCLARCPESDVVRFYLITPRSHRVIKVFDVSNFGYAEFDVDQFSYVVIDRFHDDSNFYVKEVSYA